MDILNPFCVPGTALNTLPSISSLNPHNDLIKGEGNTVALIADEETES